MNPKGLESSPLHNNRALIFSPRAWLKLQYFCHAGDTEVGGFGIAAADNCLYLEDFQTVRQETTPVGMHFDDQAVADLFDRSVDQGLTPQRFARIWCHTHPGASVTPSSTDEETFWTSFGGCDWAVMFILGRTGRTYARLTFGAGPRGDLLLPVEVDWTTWPQQTPEVLNSLLSDWQAEFQANIRPRMDSVSFLSQGPMDPDTWFDPWWDQDLRHLDLSDPFVAEELFHEAYG